VNLLLAVGQASERSPSRLFLATHKVTKGSKPLLLVGKGITFDTGGINLKPHESFVNCMKNDMGGAGLMAQLFMALVESGYPGPLALAIPACENLIDAKAMKPGAVIRSFAGKDVIIEHTDAEGRLILADALNYSQKLWEPSLTIIAATLTTASLRQFTNFFTPVHFANEPFQKALAAAGKSCGEEFTFWDAFLPFLAGNKSNAADLTNMGRMPSHSSMGGACNVAAHFLREFAVAPMIHVDIFACTWNWSGDYPGAHYGATGAPFNALFHALRTGSPDLWGYR
jgi:leucyl aminopeptidase